MTTSHTAKYATGIERIHPSQHAAYLRARSAVFHADRSSGGAQVFYSAPLRRWLKLWTERPGVIVVEHHATCPCSIVA